MNTTAQNTVEKETNGTVFDGMSNEQIMLKLYVDSVQIICRLDEDILEGNIALVGTMDDDDRIVPLEAMMFIAQNAGQLTAMLGLKYKNIFDIFADALEDEIHTDDMSDEEKTAYRRKTQNKDFAESKFTMCMGVNVFGSNILREITEAASASYNLCNKPHLMKELEESVKNMSDDDRAILSVILSNCVYLLRAFSKNASFIQDIAALIQDFNENML